MDNQNYSYPINDDWTTEELITVTNMFGLVEDVYEGGANREAVLTQYRKFKDIVQSKFEEKQLGRQFAHDSGYVLYEVIKLANSSDRKTIRLER